MSKKFIAAALLTSLLGATACSHTVRHTTPLPALADDDEISATTSMLTGDQISQPLQVSSAGPTAFTSMGGRPVENSRVIDVTVTTRDHARGAGEGAIIGLGVGTLSGLALGMSAGASTTCAPDDTSCSLFDPLGDAIVGASAVGAGMLIGTLAGGIIGGVVGHRQHDVYAASAVPQLGVAPTVGGAQASAAWRF